MFVLSFVFICMFILKLIKFMINWVIHKLVIVNVCCRSSLIAPVPRGQIALTPTTIIITTIVNIAVAAHANVFYLPFCVF